MGLIEILLLLVAFVALILAVIGRISWRDALVTIVVVVVLFVVLNAVGDNGGDLDASMKRVLLA